MANHADHFQGDVDALAAALVEEPETARRRQICEVTTKARPTREDTTLTAQQEARLEERAQKRAAREEAKLLKKAEIFKNLGFSKEKENCERFALRLGAGLESTIVGDLTIPRQLLELRDETLKSGATPRRGVLLPLIDAARAAGRKTRDETLGDLSIARFPSREDTMSADEASAVLDHARAVVDAEQTELTTRVRLGQHAIKQFVLLRRSACPSCPHHCANNVDQPGKLALYHLNFSLVSPTG